MKRHFSVLALVAVTVVPATALAASRQKHAHELSTTLTGAVLGNTGPVFTSAAVAKDAAIGRGAAIVTVTTPSTIEGTLFYPGGSITTKGTITFGTPDANGTTSTTGSGKITAGTGKYHGATGSITFTGSQDANGHYKVSVTGSLKY
jgi:hypothetical protein